MNFTVDRATWLHGESSGPSYLLRRSDSKKCCLGFRALACGYTEEQIMQIASPIGLFRDYGKRGPKLTDEDLETWKGHFYLDGNEATRRSLTERDIMTANDDPLGTKEERETRLIELFSLLGDTLTFTGEYPNV